jgi:hypothetical protein
MDIPSLDDKPKKQDEGVGPLIGIIIVVALVAAGGIYFLFTQEMHRQATPLENQANLQ